MESTNQFNPDRPVFKRDDDKFQRYPFAKRIADTIKNSNREDCIVMGIYGEWGEGKSSLMDFIDNELQTDKEIIRIKFNPWRFSEESTLLLNFFNHIAKELEIDIFSKKERAGKNFKQKSDLFNVNLPYIGNISNIISAVGSLLYSTELEVLKKRLVEKISNEKKLVIFIDDIDRLDKDEIHAVFRLVKLTADLPHTTYILGFDHKVVSSILSERYPTGDNESGKSYLEKIIQVPLLLPKAQPQAIINYYFDSINTILEKNKIVLDKYEKNRLENQFISSILPYFTTPRIIIRYSNSLSFIMPLLCGEVNIVDLVIIEAIKIIKPDLYDFIKDNPNYFVGGYDTPVLRSSKEEQNQTIINSIKEHIGNDLHKAKLINLLQALFPRLEWTYNPTKEYYVNQEKLTDDKNIASPKYFPRYFSYCVIDGQLSDVSFYEYKNKILSIKNKDEIEKLTFNLIKESIPKEFLYCIRKIENELPLDIYCNIAIILSKISSIFIDNDIFENYNLGSSSSQLMGFITCRLIEIYNDEYIYNYTEEVIKNGDKVKFVISFFDNVMSDDLPHKYILSGGQRKKITLLFVEKVISLLNETPIFENYKSESRMFFDHWKKYEPKQVHNYITSMLAKNPDNYVEFIAVYVNEFFKRNSEQDELETEEQKKYRYFKSIIDPEIIYLELKKQHKDILLNTPDIEMNNQLNDEYSKINLINQFIEWHERNRPPKIFL